MQTWQQIADQINRKLVESASPMVDDTEMVGLLNETYDELFEEWIKLLSEKDESAIQLLAPLLRPAIGITLTGVIFYIDTTNFPGGARWIASLRGDFVQSCSNTAESRNIEFLSMNERSDFDNPLRKPDNDHPKYSVWYDAGASKKKVTIHCESAPATVNAFYYRNPTVLATIMGSPEIGDGGDWRIIKRAVDKQCGTNLDERKPITQAETNKDTQIQLT